MSQRIDSLLNQYDCGAIDRRQLLAGLAAMATLSKVVSAEEPKLTKPAFEAKSLNHVTLSVYDVQKSKDFYESILGVSTISMQKNGINLGVGDSFIGLYAIKEPPRVNHFCVGVDEYHVQAAAERLRQFGITPRVRQDKPEVYFQDPDGIAVQLESVDYRG